jgi:hypothetical protein
VTTGGKQEGLAIVKFLNKLIVSCKEAVRIPILPYLHSEHRQMRAKQQHVCKEMNIYEQYQPEVVFKFQHRMYNRSESPEIAY